MYHLRSVSSVPYTKFKEGVKYKNVYYIRNPFIIITCNIILITSFNHHLVKLNSNIPSTFLLIVQFLNVEIKQIVWADLVG